MTYNINKELLLENVNSGQSLKLNNNLKEKVSKIAGKGIFTNTNIRPNQIVGLAFKGSGTKIIRTKLGEKVNHSEQPNLEYIKSGDEYYFKTLKNIPKNTELFINYKKFDFSGKTDFTKD